MNRINKLLGNFSNLPQGFPVDTDLFTALQNQIKLAMLPAIQLFDNKDEDETNVGFILQGDVRAGDAGYVIVRNENDEPEVLWVEQGSSSATTLYLVSAQVDVTQQSSVYTNAWRNRYLTRDVTADYIKTYTISKLVSVGYSYASYIEQFIALRTQVNQIVADPIGTIKMWGGTETPDFGGTWLLCNGGAYSKTEYSDLFDVIGTTYGSTDTTFNVPPLNGRVPVGQNTGDSDFALIGQTGGEKKHQLNLEEMPKHAHTYSTPSWHDRRTTSSGSYTMPDVEMSSATGITGGSVAVDYGYGVPHNNLQPYLVIRYYIKAKND